MPRIEKLFTLDITPERFLNACDATELRELELLLGSPRYQRIINDQETLRIEGGEE